MLPFCEGLLLKASLATIVFLCLSATPLNLTQENSWLKPAVGLAPVGTQGGFVITNKVYGHVTCD